MLLFSMLNNNNKKNKQTNFSLTIQGHVFHSKIFNQCKTVFQKKKFVLLDPLEILTQTNQSSNNQTATMMMMIQYSFIDLI